MAEAGENVREPACRGAGISSSTKRELGLSDGRKAAFRPECSVVGEDRDLGQYPDSKTGRNCGLQPRQVRARECDMPGTPRRLERVNGMVAIKTALVRR